MFEKRKTLISRIKELDIEKKELADENKKLRDEQNRYLGNVDFKKEYKDILDGLTENDKRSIYNEASFIIKGQAFKKVVSYLINKQANYDLRYSLADDNRVFSRGTINGVELVEEELMKLASLKDMPEEKFNKYSI